MLVGFGKGARWIKRTTDDDERDPLRIKRNSDDWLVKFPELPPRIRGEIDLNFEDDDTLAVAEEPVDLTKA